MAVPRDDAGDLERALELLAPILVSETLDEAATRATQLCATLSGARVVALFLASGQDTGAEFWSPADEATRLRFRPHFRGLALESLAQGAPVASPFPPGLADGLEPSVLPLVNRGRTLALVCLAGPPGAAERCAPACAPVARQLAQQQDAAQSQTSKVRYERWFRQFDQQMRLLERERQRFAAVVNQADTYVFSTDSLRIVRWASRAMSARFRGAGGTDWTGRSCDEVWAHFGASAGSAAAMVCPVASVLETGRPAHHEFVQQGEGPARTICVSALPIHDPEGRTVEVLVLVQDLTGLQALRRVEHGLHAVVSNAPVVLFAVDREGVFTLSEGRGLASLGLQPGQVVGASAYEFYRDHPRIVECLRRALAGEDFTAVVAVGDLTFETRYAPQRNEAGEVVGVTGVATDVTERCRLEARLRDSQQAAALGRLAAGVANDFGDLLAAIMGHAGLLLGQLPQEHPLRQPAQEVQRAGTRGAQLVRQLQTLSRGEAAAPRPIDADSLLVGMEGLLRRLTGGDVELVIVRGPRPSMVLADRTELEQALLNLVGKARDALPRGGRITIERGETELGAQDDGRQDLRPGGYVTLAVSVTGAAPGEPVPAPALEGLLAAQMSGGPGLGLALTKEIVRRCGGDLIARADAGGGAVIAMRLPRLDEASEPPLRAAA